jgi:sugar lactone lactonase YvrE
MRALTVLATALTLSGVWQVAAAAAPSFPGAGPDYKSWVFPAVPGQPEGLAMNSRGRLYAVVLAKREVYRLDEKGRHELYATVPSKEQSTVGYSVGAAFDRNDNLFVAYFWGGSKQPWENDPLQLACRDSTDQYTGIYRVDAATRAVTPVLTKAQGWPVCVPDDVAVDAQGNIYVSDLTLSGIWKIRKDGSFVLWSADALLQWPPPPFGQVFAGANPVALDHDEKNLYVGTIGHPAILRIPVEADGSAGKPVIVAQDVAPLDGLELDAEGRIYASEPTYNRIHVIAADGKRRTLIATEDTAPLQHPTSLVYRNGTLCAANFLSETDPRPGTVVCISGFRP